jgi:hypothetical protein
MIIRFIVLILLVYIIIAYHTDGNNVKRFEHHDRHLASGNTYEFVPWPHRKIFDGYLKEGMFLIDDIDYFTSKLADFDVSGLDNIQTHAVHEGIFFPNRENFPKFHLFSSNEANSCIKGKNIHFFGDSYIQQSFIGFGEVILNKPSNMEILNGSVRNVEVGHIQNRIDKHLDEETAVKFVMDNCRHGDLKCAISELDSNASLLKADVLIGNILVHHMTLHREEMGYLDDYVIQLKSLLKKAKTYQLTWATGPSYVITRVPEQYRNITRNSPTEFMNFKAIDLAEELDVPLLDFFSLTHSCKWSNCTSDGGHRSRFVNRMKAQMILNNICKLSSD